MLGTGRPLVTAQRWAALVVLTALVSGCVGARSGGVTSASPTASSTAIAATPASAVPSESPSATQTQSPTGTPFVTPAPTARPTAVVDPLPNVPQAPAGTWKSIHWTELPATPAFGANVSDSPWDPKVGVPNTTFQVFGWSHGFVGFTITAGHDTGQVDSYGNDIYTDPTLASSYSADGVHWHAGQKLLALRTGSGLPLQTIRAVVEGPAGLMAVGWTGSCASEYLYELWTSTDGKTWQAVDTKTSRTLTNDFAVTHVSGGAAGYVSVAYKSAGAWTSKDGRNWQAVPLNTGPFANSLVNDGTAVTGGFVLAGLDGTPDCGTTVVEQGDTPPPPVSRTAAVWWSADGTSWTHISLPGAVSSSQYGDTWVSRLGDQKVLVENGGQAWVSSDGQTWTPANLPGVTQDAIVAQGQHNLVVKGLGVDAGEGSWSPVAAGKLGLQTINGSSALVSIGQTGDAPELVYWDGYYGPYGMVAVGPTGVVVTSADGSQLWFGTPTTK